MPAINENVSAVTTVQVPQSTSAARGTSVRGRRPSAHSPAARRISAAGSSQLIWPPISESNNRPRPVAPQLPPPLTPPPPPPPPPPTLPTSLPVSRPSPL